ncbi:AraC family transcriptional regulator [Paenibacillus antibioticophila]|uniref:AraC family transcriptional regulator n=1 Tax=Paenibacillus antibioticophila TaxID=1274374 RepID=A0A919XQB9_9BACL|nr:AraC family transcriptional regulator [Paenibacillus antibioticophila]GIO35603.1 AraC family transcriptional regulator [Paenibacillus antibioticophila]
MHAWEAIQKTLEYIEDHISESQEIDELAAIAALSPFYYQRLFSRLVKKPVREYIRYRRLANACEALGRKENRILDVALEWGFGSHEGFTRAFKEAYGITPEQYREYPVRLNHFTKPDLSLGYTLIDEGVPLISDGLVLEVNRRTLEQPILFIGLSDYVPIDGQLPLGEATGVDVPGEVWRQFHERKGSISRLPRSRELGVAFLGDAPEGSFTYFAGAEALPDADPGEFKLWQLPAREYVVFGFEAESFEELVTSALNKALNYSELWLKKHGMVNMLYAPELYYDFTPEASYMELWLPADNQQD